MLNIVLKYGINAMTRKQVQEWQTFLRVNRQGFNRWYWEEFYQALEQRDAQLDVRAERVRQLFAGFSGEAPAVELFKQVVVNTGEGRKAVTVKALYTLNGVEYLNGQTFDGNWYMRIPVASVFKRLSQ